MEFSKTKSSTGLAISPFEVRAGSVCELTMRCTKHTDVTWDLSQVFDQTFSGFVTKESMSVPELNLSLYPELEIRDTGAGSSRVIIQPPWTFSKETTLRIYYTAIETQSITAQPAMGLIRITETADIEDDWTVEMKHEIASLHSVGSYTYNEPTKYSKTIQITGEVGSPPDTVDVDYSYWNDYHEDYIIEDGRVIPMTTITPVFDTNSEYNVNSFSITPPDNNGIFYVDDEAWELNSTGTLSIRNNILRNGKVEAIVPLESELPFLRYETLPKGQPKKKVIEIEDQRCSVDVEFFGGLSVGKMIFIMTSKGLYAFDHWSKFITPEYYWPTIKGTDLSYLPNDTLAIANGDKIETYACRHDFAHIDYQGQRVYTRENDSDLKVNGVSILT